jgi:hypothetical protein
VNELHANRPLAHRRRHALYASGANVADAEDAVGAWRSTTKVS